MGIGGGAARRDGRDWLCRDEVEGPPRMLRDGKRWKENSRCSMSVDERRDEDGDEESDDGGEGGMTWTGRSGRSLS